MLGGISRGPWVTKEKKKAYQPLRIKSSSYGCNDFRRETKTRINPLTDGQSGSINVYKKNGVASREGGGGKVNQKMNQISKELWQFLIENAITIIVENVSQQSSIL